MYRPENAPPAKVPTVSVVLGTYGRLPFLQLSIESLRAELADFPSEIIVVDGGSTDGTLSWLARQKDIITIIQHNRGEWRGKPIPKRSWGYFMNMGFKAAQGRYVCMISDDSLVVPGAIRNGCRDFDVLRDGGREVGAMAFWWRNWPEQPDYWIGQTWGNRIFVNHGLYLNQALKDVDYIDEETYRFYCADGDLSLRIWENGYEILPAPDSYLEHFNYANMRVRTSNNQVAKQDFEAYRQRWEAQLGPSTQDWIYQAHAETSGIGERYRPFYRRYCIKKRLSRYFKWLK